MINAKVYDSSNDENICLCELSFVDRENFTDNIAIVNDSLEFKKISKEFDVEVMIEDCKVKES